MRLHPALRAYDPRRSSRWPKVRRAHLKLEPSCRACGATEKLQAHHILPFHIAPEHELSQDNLITLCEKPGHDCHFRYGHFLNWRLQNPSVRQDAADYLAKYKKARGE